MKDNQDALRSEIEQARLRWAEAKRIETRLKGELDDLRLKLEQGAPGHPVQLTLFQVEPDARTSVESQSAGPEPPGPGLDGIVSLTGESLSPPGENQQVIQDPPGRPQTDGAKVELFKALFRGREDAFAVGRQPLDGGKPKYYPCRLDGELVPLSDRVLLDHLRGKQFIGVYPILRDDTCWFLALDFDKARWKEDAWSFAATSRRLGFIPAIERSRSGQGAHAWFFFSAPLPAALARRFGSFLLSEAMIEHGGLEMSSFDRLFPSQDSLPKRGFGNLIALPFQGVAREKGNSLFVDETWNPFGDQWAFLGEVRRIGRDAIERALAAADSTGLSCRIPSGPFQRAGTETKPWERLPSGRPRALPQTGSVPPRIEAELAARLYVPTLHLTRPLLAQLEWLAAFHNPEFYRKDRQRFSTWNTPRIICRAERTGEHLALPRGCLDKTRALLHSLGSDLLVSDRRQLGPEASFAFEGHLEPDQEAAVRALEAHDIGVLVAPPGSGKTVMAIALLARRNRGTLVLVHRRTLLDQWVERLQQYLKVQESEVGVIAAGKSKPNGRLDVAMIGTLAKIPELPDFLDQYGQIVVDECHHVPAYSTERVLAASRPRYVLGLTATPYRQDGHDPIIHLECGEVRFTLQGADPEGNGSIQRALLVRHTGVGGDWPTELKDSKSFHAICEALIQDQLRNDLVERDVTDAIRAGRNCLVLTERREHLALLERRLAGVVPRLVVLAGGLTERQRREARSQLQTWGPDPVLILATGRCIGEGFDDNRLDALFLTMPISFKGNVEQYVGRLLRRRENKRDVLVYDYADGVGMLQGMLKKRLQTFRRLHFSIQDAPPASWLTPTARSSSSRSGIR